MLEGVLRRNDVRSALVSRRANPTAGLRRRKLLTMGKIILTMGKSDYTILTDDRNAHTKTLGRSLPFLLCSLLSSNLVDNRLYT